MNPSGGPPKDSGRPPVAPPPPKVRGAVGTCNGRNLLILGDFRGISAPAPENLPPHVPPGFFTPNTFYQAQNRNDRALPNHEAQNRIAERALTKYVAHDFSYMGPIVNHEPPGYDPFNIAYENRPIFDPHIEDITKGYEPPYHPIDIAYYNDMMPAAADDTVPPIAYQTARRLPANSNEEAAAPPFLFIPTSRAPPRLTGVRFHKPTPFPRTTRRRGSR